MAKRSVDRATSDSLMGPDWAMNMEICDILNQEPSRTKDAIKALKKRINHKKPKVQILALTLLEIMMKNCGDLVHMLVAEKDILRTMVKIAKKKNPDFRVKEKILVSIDSWQETFGGPRAKYPQYYVAYQDLLKAGAVFPQRPENSVPIITPPQTQPLQNYPTTLRESHTVENPDRSPISISQSEMQHARGVMDILSEMLNALDPANRVGLRQEIIVDLVDQCRSFKNQVVTLVNTTSDEELLSQGLALNDDLQKVLALHGAIAAGIAVKQNKPLIQTAKQDSNSNNIRSVEIAAPQLVPLPESKSTNVVKADPLIDLLSGDDNYLKPESDKDALALVPVTPLTTDDQNVLALSDMFIDLHSEPKNNNNNNNNTNNNNNNNNVVRNSRNVAPTFRAVRDSPPQQRYQGPTFRANSTAMTVYDPQAQFNNGVNNQSGALPPPPWKSQQTETGTGFQTNYPIQQSMQVVPPGYVAVAPQPMMVGQLSRLQSMPAYNNYPYQPQFQQFYSGQIPTNYYVPTANMYPHASNNNNNGNYANAANYYRTDSTASSSSSTNSYSNNNNNNNNYGNNDMKLAKKNNKPEDKMFGDLVNMASFKRPNKPMNKVGTM